MKSQLTTPSGVRTLTWPVPKFQTDSGIGLQPANGCFLTENSFAFECPKPGSPPARHIVLASEQETPPRQQDWIHLSSPVEHGSTFRVYLPTPAHPATPTVQPDSKTPVCGGKETLLVVEDEDAVRQLAVLWLQKLGYTILEAEDAAEARELWKTQSNQVALLLTDIMLPGGINGLELARQLRKDKPELKVIASSGYSAELIRPRILLENAIAYLSKPWEPTLLARTVRTCLDRPFHGLGGAPNHSPLREDFR